MQILGINVNAKRKILNIPKMKLYFPFYDNAFLLFD